MLAEDNKFRSKPPKDFSAEEHIFLCSLISNVRFSDSLKILTCSSPDYRTSKAASHNNKNPGVTMKGFQVSPYPEIDDFILSLVTREGFQGSIRSWHYFSSEELLVYETANYRWCANIRRAHKSNNVMLLVDVKREVWYQKCHDPICRAQNFKSECLPLPSEVCLPFLFKEDDEESIFTMDENGNIKETKINRSLVPMADKPSIARSGETMGPWERHCDSEIDDACILEAIEDIEFSDAVDTSLAHLELDDVGIPDEDIAFVNAVDTSLAHLELDYVGIPDEDIVFVNAVDTSLAHLELDDVGIPDEDIAFVNAVDTSLAHLGSDDVGIPDEDIEFVNAVDNSLAHLDSDDLKISDEDVAFVNAVDNSLAHLDSDDEDIEFVNAVDTSL
uniref:DNA-directed primase/polymerase protein n=1 Tax=Xenopus tropicalis TaxID=8364 RepID=F6S7I5_XENTR